MPTATPWRKSKFVFAVAVGDRGVPSPPCHEPRRVSARLGFFHFSFSVAFPFAYVSNSSINLKTNARSSAVNENRSIVAANVSVPPLFSSTEREVPDVFTVGFSSAGGGTALGRGDRRVRVGRFPF